MNNIEKLHPIKEHPIKEHPIKEYRNINRIGQADFSARLARICEIANISKTSISSWENGKDMPSVGIVTGLCEMLGVTPEMLYRFYYDSRMEYLS